MGDSLFPLSYPPTVSSNLLAIPLGEVKILAKFFVKFLGKSGLPARSELELVGR